LLKEALHDSEFQGMKEAAYTASGATKNVLRHQEGGELM
jgi:hypothetical protein